MDSNDSSANTTITFGEAAAPAATTSDDEHLTVSSSSEDKRKKSAEKRRQGLFRRQEMRKESRPSAAGSSQRTPGARSSSATSSRKVILDSVKKRTGESTPPTRKSPRGSPSAPQSSSKDEARGEPHGSPQRDLLYGQSHGVDIRIVEELQAKLAEMTQEDEGATLRIMQLERERDNALALVRHVHERHLSEIQQHEARQQLRERHLQASEHQIRAQREQAQELRDEATHAILQIGQQSQGEMFDMTKEYQKITQMMHQKSAENSALRSDLRFAEQLMMEAKEAMERSEAQESFAFNEIQLSKQAMFVEEQQRAQVANQEFQRIKEVFYGEITAERERLAQFEANQRPILPSLHEEIVSLRTEVNVQDSELRSAKAELRVASARSSEWEHAGNSVGFPSTHVSHTPVTVVSPAGSNSRNGSNNDTPEKGIESTIPPAPQGPPVTYGPDPSVAHGPSKAVTQNPSTSSFRELADGLFRPSVKSTINWGAPMYTLEQAFPPTAYGTGDRTAPIQVDTESKEVHRVEPPPGLSSNGNQASSSTSRATLGQNAQTQRYTGILDELRRKLINDANAAPATKPNSNPPGMSGNIEIETPGVVHPDGEGVGVDATTQETNDVNQSEEIRQLIAELSRARKSEERMRKERNDWKGWAETFESELEESKKGKEDPPDDGKQNDKGKSTGGPSSGGGDGVNPSGGGGGDPGDGDDITNPGGWKPGGMDPGSGDPPGDGADTGDLANDKPKISRREADKVVVPPFPKVLNLDAWKASTTTNVLAACADPHQEDWVRWLQEAYKPFPDIEKLNDSGGVRFNSIDVKLASAMISMLKGAGDGANDLSLDVNFKANAYIRGNQFTVIKGRQIIAMMMESFRTRDRIDVIYTIDHFTKIQYPGDNKLATFKATWLEVIGRMRPEDVPSKNALRDLLYLKIKGSNLMKLELQLL